jgi:hypothetical protein
MSLTSSPFLPFLSHTPKLTHFSPSAKSVTFYFVVVLDFDVGVAGFAVAVSDGAVITIVFVVYVVVIVAYVVYVFVVIVVFCYCTYRRGC